MADNFDVFEDRVKSLLERWHKHKDNNPSTTPQSAIKACLTEINDGYTDQLIKED